MNTKNAPVMSTEIKNDLSAYPEFLQKLLFHRGITDAKTAEAFLRPDYEEHQHNVSLLHDIEKATTRILEAIRKNEHIAIYADYDADGIPGSVILHDFFKKINYENFEVYLPHRHEEGYGFHADAVDTLAQNETKLIITVDVGIVAHDTVTYANNLNIDVIVTDHHEPSATLPDAIAIVNPKLGEYPERMLCGAAVAWKLVVALIDAEDFTIKEGWEKWLLDMVGIATISDLVPLTGENRMFAHFGLRVLQKSRRPGLKLLLKKAGVNQRHLSEDDISFMITPRINAASRMSHPIEAFKVLAAKKTKEAKEAVDHLVVMNDDRKKLVATTMRHVNASLKKREIHDVIVIGDPEWQAGILGLVATKITETYNRPSFVWSREGDVIKGSCRGAEGTNVLDIMEAARDAFLEFGGHAGAGGFSVATDKIHFLEEALVEAYKNMDTPDEIVPKQIMLEGNLVLNDVNKKNYRLIEQCAPFGAGNPKPAFLFENVVVDTAKTFGKTKNHLEISFKNSRVRAIQFFKTPDDYEVDLSPGSTISLLAHFDFSVFGGRSELRLRILDIS